MFTFSDHEDVCWTIQQFGTTGNIVREGRFTTNEERDQNVVYRRHNQLDIGIVVLPGKYADGKRFAQADERPLALIDRELGVSTGTRVGWAGFSGIVEEALALKQA